MRRHLLRVVFLTTVLGLGSCPAALLTVTPASALVAQVAFSCPGASFAFPLAAGSIYWTYRDPMTEGAPPDPSGLHSGIDLFPPGNHQQRVGVAVYAPANGYVS